MERRSRNPNFWDYLVVKGNQVAALSNISYINFSLAWDKTCESS